MMSEKVFVPSRQFTSEKTSTISVLVIRVHRWLCWKMMAPMSSNIKRLSWLAWQVGVMVVRLVVHGVFMLIFQILSGTNKQHNQN